jgi:uncharacterized protein YicC (UPF0701 family)
MEFDAVEPALRAAIRKRVSRGHVQIQIFFKRTAESGGSAAVNETLLKTWLDAFHDIASRYGLDSKPDLNQGPPPPRHDGIHRRRSPLVRTR